MNGSISLSDDTYTVYSQTEKYGYYKFELQAIPL